MLWFDMDAETAAKHYVRAFANAKITHVETYPEGGPVPDGSVMTVAFELAGQHFTGLNAGPMFKLNEAVSFVVSCGDQREGDFLWDHLAQGGAHSMCGWLKDKWGFSWQIVPKRFVELVSTSDAAAKARVFGAMMQMQKFENTVIEKAVMGQGKFQ